MTSAPPLHHSSVAAWEMLIKALHNGGRLSAEDHRQCVKEAGNGACKVRMKEEEDYLDGLKVPHKSHYWIYKIYNVSQRNVLTLG